MDRESIGDEVVIGSPPTSAEDVRGLAREGFQSLLNLRPPSVSAPFSSREEGVCANENGLTYLNYPLSGDDVDDFHLDALRTKLKLLPKPVFVHTENRQLATTLVDRQPYDQ